MTDMKIKFPAAMDLQIYITDGTMFGKACASFRPGFFVTEEAIRERIAKFERDEMPEGFRLMTKREVWEQICDEHAGGASLAMPGGEEFDK